MTVRGVATAAVIAIAIWAVVIALRHPARAQSGAHGDGHAEMHAKYKGWHPPENPNVSCCDNTDCRPTRGYLGDDGLWRAWNGIVWLTVPPGRLLPTDFAGDGRSHLCEKEGYVYCFTPGPPRI